MNSLEINESATYKTEYNSGDKKKEIITYDGVSVYIVTGGDGVFYFSGEPHECHKSDMYVFSDGVPHGILQRAVLNSRRYAQCDLIPHSGLTVRAVTTKATNIVTEFFAITPLFHTPC